MKPRIKSLISIFIVLIFLFVLSVSCTQQKEEAGKGTEETAVEAVEVQVGSEIQDETWGSSGKIGISFVRTIGEAEA